MKLRSQKTQSPILTVKSVLVYASICTVVFSAIAWAVFLFVSDGTPDDALAANSYSAMAAGDSYSSTRSGTWTTGTTWVGGSAPSTNLNGETITVNAGHSVTLGSTLNVQNNTTFVINGTLTINGNLDVKNNLILTITGSLIINGRIDVKNNASITVNGGGTFTSSGDLAFGNNANITVNGNMNVGGNLTFGSGATFHGNGNVAVTGTSCSQWTGPGGCSDNTTLPIELISFNAESNKDGVILHWKTASELNNDHFTIERSQDGINYTDIAEVNGSGTTDEITEYEYTDTDPINGTSYYRLSQTDFDGKSETFKPVPVQTTASGSLGMSAYPNPITGNTLHVKFSNPKKGMIELIDSRGNNLLSESTDGLSDEIQLTINIDIKPGLYYLNFKSGSLKETVKLIK